MSPEYVYTLHQTQLWSTCAQFDVGGRYSPCVTTSIPAGFHLVFPFHPLTHIDPRLSTGMVPSPSPNLTPLRTSGIDPLTDTAESIQFFLARGKSRGARLDVALSQ
jgi:hypothetical protein